MITNDKQYIAAMREFCEASKVLRELKRKFFKKDPKRFLLSVKPTVEHMERLQAEIAEYKRSKEARKRPKESSVSEEDPKPTYVTQTDESSEFPTCDGCGDQGARPVTVKIGWTEHRLCKPCAQTMHDQLLIVLQQLG